MDSVARVAAKIASDYTTRWPILKPAPHLLPRAVGERRLPVTRCLHHFSVAMRVRVVEGFDSQRLRMPALAAHRH